VAQAAPAPGHALAAGGRGRTGSGCWTALVCGGGAASALRTGGSIALHGRALPRPPSPAGQGVRVEGASGERRQKEGLLWVGPWADLSGVHVVREQGLADAGAGWRVLLGCLAEPGWFALGPRPAGNRLITDLLPGFQGRSGGFVNLGGGTACLSSLLEAAGPGRRKRTARSVRPLPISSRAAPPGLGPRPSAAGWRAGRAVRREA